MISGNNFRILRARRSGRRGKGEGGRAKLMAREESAIFSSYQHPR